MLDARSLRLALPSVRVGVVTNQPASPLPHLIEKTNPTRPGLTSVVDGLLTFRYVDLLRHPRNTQGRRVYPRHRTSVWTQVYARTHSIISMRGHQRGRARIPSS